MVENTSEWGVIAPAERTEVLNPIRTILEKEMKPPKDHPKALLNFGLGEPTKANGYEVPEAINQSVIDAIQGGHNGYTQASGSLAARQAVAEKFGTADRPIDPNHVFLGFGCSGALNTAISALCERGTTLLVPRPGFPLCQPICQNLGVNFDFYDLDAEKGWEADLDSLEKAINEKTSAILVNNPSNPNGSCWTVEHQKQILAIAEKHKLPIIADEVYYGLSYDADRPFESFGNLTKTVPVLTTGSLSKIYIVPGWRCGWVIAYDNEAGSLKKVIENMNKHSMILLHPNSLVQQAIPSIFKNVPDSFFDGLKEKLGASSKVAFDRLSKIKGIKPVQSRAAMYMMVKIETENFKDIEDDIDFCKKLLQEQNCLTFPSQCFFAKGFFRMVICQKAENLIEFGDRLEEFINAHLK